MKKCLLYALALPFASCALPQHPVSSEPAHNNKEYIVEFLFEHDGCKIYRFYDINHYVYFTNCRGETITKTDSVTVTRNMTEVRRN